MSKLVVFVIFLLSISQIYCRQYPRGSVVSEIKKDPARPATGAPLLHPIWPAPSKYISGGNYNVTISDWCDFSFSLISNNNIPQISNITSIYLGYMFPNCTQDQRTRPVVMEMTEEMAPSANHNTLIVNISNTQNILMSLETDESYNLEVSLVSMILTANSYVGFVRGLETFSQMLFYSWASNNTVSGVWIPSTPVVIIDSPRYNHRGLMLDTARHYMPIDTIYSILDGLSFTKISVFHWHITDSDSFPIQSLSHPNLTTYGAFSPSQTYSQLDVDNIVQYAILRGIMIIPEIDSPSHLASWSLAPEASHLINCTTQMFYTGIPLGQINPTLNETYELVGDIYGDLDSYFPWKTIHFGCDEVFGWCWNNTGILDWMHEHNMSDTSDLFNYYVQTQRTVKPNGTQGLYWSNAATLFLEFEESDIIQYWGDGSQMPQAMENYPDNRFILSNYDALYFDCGYGNYFGANSWCDPYHTWLQIYQWEPTTLVDEKYWGNIIGAEACQWQELNNNYTIMDRVFPRIAALAERTWSPLNNPYNDTLSVFERLQAWRVRVADRGIPSMPLSAGYCEKNPAMCF
jgi:hexosaminidase